MSTLSAEVTTDTGSDWDVPKNRRCLRCKALFTSQWSGERVCARCKKSNAWKRGELARAFSTHATR